MQVEGDVPKRLKLVKPLGDDGENIGVGVEQKRGVAVEKFSQAKWGQKIRQPSLHRDGLPLPHRAETGKRGAIVGPAGIADGAERLHARKGKAQAQKSHPGVKDIQKRVFHFKRKALLPVVYHKGISRPRCSLCCQRGQQCLDVNGIARSHGSLAGRLQHGLDIFVEIHRGHANGAAQMCQTAAIQAARIIF